MKWGQSVRTVLQGRLFEGVAVDAEVFQVAGAGGAVAAYVDNSSRLHFYYGFQKGLVAALAGRVDNNDICIDTVSFVFTGRTSSALPAKNSTLLI